MPRSHVAIELKSAVKLFYFMREDPYSFWYKIMTAR